MDALAIAALLLLPGAWIAFALRDGSMSFAARLAWSAALSPLVVAGELFLAQRAAGSFTQAAWLVAALNVPATILMWKRWRTRRAPPGERTEWEMWRGVVVYAAVAASVSLPWYRDPAFRVYSEHSLLQLDVIYGIASSGAPWEAELAGAGLRYPWAPHASWALEAAAAQRSPTVLYPVNNLLLLAACGLLAYALARALGGSRSSATAIVALTALAADLPGLLLRQTPLLARFASFDAAGLGVALLLGVALSAIHLLRRPRSQQMLLLAAGLAGLAALYPSFLPAGAGLALGSAAVVGARARREERLRTPAVDMAGCTAAGLAGAYFVLDGYGLPLTARPAAELAGASFEAVLALAPLAAGCWLYAKQRSENRDEAVALAAGAGAATVAGLALRIGGEVAPPWAAAGLLLLPPALLGASMRFTALRGRLGWLTPIALVAAGLAMLSYSSDRRGTAPAVDERSFFVSLAPRNREGRWMAAVRVKSDPGDVLVVYRPRIHVSTFSARRLLVGSDRGTPHSGCALSTRFNLVELRGHDPDLVDRRLALLERIYRPARARTRSENDELLEAVAAEAGPNLLFAFLPGDDRSFLDYLRNQRHARVIYDDGERTVAAP